MKKSIILVALKPYYKEEENNKVFTMAKSAHKYPNILLFERELSRKLSITTCIGNSSKQLRGIC